VTPSQRDIFSADSSPVIALVLTRRASGVKRALRLGISRTHEMMGGIKHREKAMSTQHHPLPASARAAIAGLKASLPIGDNPACVTVRRDAIDAAIKLIEKLAVDRDQAYKQSAEDCSRANRLQQQIDAHGLHQPESTNA